MTKAMMGHERPNTDPRIERSRRVILEATIEELAEVGYGAMTIESIAKRAGVGKATIYRQWSDKADLVESVLDAIKQDIVVRADGTVRERVTSLLRWLASFLSDSPASSCMPAIISAAHYDKAVGDFHFRFANERGQVLVELLVEGVESGELNSDLDPDFAAEVLCSPLFYRRLMTNETYSAGEVDQLVRAVLGSPS